MKCFVTGATGVVGRPLVAVLVAAGHDVVAVARRPEKAATLRAAGAQPVDVDLFEPDALIAATEGCDAILHLATHVPPATRAAKSSAWDLHNRLRTEATANLVAAAEANDVHRLVKESITFVYPDSGDRWITEATAPDPELTALAPTLKGERVALAFAEGSDRTTVVLRYGLFYGGAGNRGTEEMLRLARWRRATVAGRPTAYMSSVHADDAAAAARAALEAPTGIFNVVDDEPLRRGDYVAAFSAAYGLHKLRPLPAWTVRLAGGKSAAALVASQRVSSRRFREVTGWAPAYPSAHEGWAYEATRRELEDTHA